MINNEKVIKLNKPALKNGGGYNEVLALNCFEF